MLILASQSKARQDMLKAAKIDFKACPANLDEDATTTALLKEKVTPLEIAAALAKEKALHISTQNPNQLVIGSDQILECDGQMLSKAADKTQAEEKLKFLRGKTHRLMSSVCVARDDKILWQDTQAAFLTMHDFNDVFLETYIQEAGEALTRSVGAYELESLGVQLFKTIEGDYFTILGMPLLSLLHYLKTEHQIGL